VTTQKSLEKIPYGISVPTQETCYSSSIWSRKNTIWNICDNTEESGKNPIWNICDKTGDLLQQHSRLLSEESGKNIIWNICDNT
jgi:hypothetical protein